MILVVLSGAAASNITLASIILLIRGADDGRIGIGDKIGKSGKSENNCLSSLYFVAIHSKNTLHEAIRFGRALHIGPRFRLWKRIISSIIELSCSNPSILKLLLFQSRARLCSGPLAGPSVSFRVLLMITE